METHVQKSNNKLPKAKKLPNRQITTIAILSAISIALGSTGIGFIPLPMADATIMQIPVIIGAILEGPVAGMCIGLIFGLFSIFQSITAPNTLSFAFMNPIVSVLPRILIGVAAYYCFRLPFIKNEAVKIGVGAAAGSLMNTLGVLGAIYFLYAARYAEAQGITIETTAQAIYGIAVTNGIPEAVIAIIVVVPVVLAVKKILNR